MVFLVSFLSIHILQQDLKRWLVLWSWNLFTCDYSLQWNRGQLLFWVTTKSFSWSVQLVSREKLEQSPRSISQAVWASNGKRLLERHWGMGFLFFHLTHPALPGPCLVSIPLSALDMEAGNRAGDGRGFSIDFTQNDCQLCSVLLHSCASVGPE